jgi:hypothetical protein
MTIYLGTIAKNIEPNFFQLYLFLQDIYSTDATVKTCIYENNSTDNTHAMLKILENISPNIRVISEYFSGSELLASSKAWTWDKKPCRMELIAAARNKLLTMLADAGCSDKDYVVLFDSDMESVCSAGVILRKISEFPADADALFANGLNRNQQTYYDMYALRTQDRPCGPELLGETFWNTLPKLHFTERTPILSGFGGLAIYRGYVLSDNCYSALPTSDLNDFYKRCGVKQASPVTHIEGVLRGIYLFESDGLFYYNNSGYAYPIVCEHSTFHARAANRGQGRFYLDPELVYVSTH